MLRNSSSSSAETSVLAHLYSASMETAGLAHLYSASMETAGLAHLYSASMETAGLAHLYSASMETAGLSQITFTRGTLYVRNFQRDINNIRGCTRRLYNTTIDREICLFLLPINAL